ncbi:MAG: hypothetical protein U9P71_02685 [Campylobacterota bacterium]|nr:hypothetical protein [Campylobacterota bacterium]
MSSNKRWIIKTLASILGTLTLFAAINIFMDPLWTFEYSHPFNQYQSGGKGRQQKSNILYFRSQKYDTILFGSSRTTYMDQTKWDGKTFNYANPALQPNEYKAYLDFAIHDAKQPIKRVILGLDFYGALEYKQRASRNPKTILAPLTKPYYKLKLLFSMDTIHYSIKNFIYSFVKPAAKYQHNNVKRSKKRLSDEKYALRIARDIEIYNSQRYSKPFDENYSSYMNQMRDAYPEIEFVLFTTPVCTKHFKESMNQETYIKYERWLKETVNVFGKVHHFMYINALSDNARTYFQDSNHAFIETNECVSNQILQKPSQCPEVDMIITKENLEEKLQLLRTLNDVPSTF